MCCGQECLGGGKGSQAKPRQSSSNDRGADHTVRENFSHGTVVYVVELLAFYRDYGPPIRSAHGPIRTGSPAPHKNGNSESRAQRPSRLIIMLTTIGTKIPILTKQPRWFQHNRSNRRHCMEYLSDVIT
jgi:hypothetical protein